MRANCPIDLVCMGSLADAEVQRVATYPRANHDVVVEQSATLIAADWPSTAVTA